ncbi:TlpA family protein disulfide reductase [Pseudoalteromonas sp. T1lg23B]|uniref:TlpA family protein disulfide reductase n=1 Tax=Pseudoalteromonas sp. T1lg23B TaxID=2077097 RepID=UPI000CF6F390|nr:TlpA disulfide reductase family protein [Pseudoalteromonas sp. T1lg23B]
MFMKIIHTLKITAVLLCFGITSAMAKAPQVGDIAPNFEVTTLDGKKLSLSEFKGKKAVYLKFWSTWCSYCIAEMHHLQNTFDRLGQDVEVVAINIGLNDSIENITKLYTQENYQLPTVFDKKGHITQDYGVLGTPHHVVINKQGKIAYRTFLVSDELDETLNKLAAKASSQTHLQGE